MKRIFLSLLALTVITLMPALAAADTINFSPTPKDLYDLDHYEAYVWGVNHNLNGQQVKSATLTFSNIRNWNNDPNRLYVYLLDSTLSNQVTRFNDGDTPNTTSDFFKSNGVKETASGTLKGVKLFEFEDTLDGSEKARTEGTVKQTFTYKFTETDLANLTKYLSVGNNFSIGFDPDCHYWNDGITLTLETIKNTPPTPPNAPVPEPTTMALLGSGLAGMYYRRRRQRQQQAAEASIE